jgi:DNA-binding response OmpR family regulator
MEQLAPVEEQARRVLVIDDELDHSEIIGALLRREGFRVEVSLDARAGVARAVEQPPDLILLDLWMPALDGFSAAECLRKHPRTADVPIIFLSACGERMAGDHGVDLSEVGFLAKPFHAAELLEMARSALGLDA